MNRKMVLVLAGLCVILYGFAAEEIGSHNVNDHPMVVDVCQRAATLNCSPISMPPGGVDCNGKLDELKSETERKIDQISVGVGVFAKTVEVKARTISRQNQQVEVTCRGYAFAPLWPVDTIRSFFTVQRP